MPRRDYPDEIKLQVENRVKYDDSNAFNTEDQKKAARHLKEHWPIQFNDLAEKTGEFTDGMYRRVIKNYFGPADSDLTFEELWDEYGTLEQYYKRHNYPDEIELKVTDQVADTEDALSSEEDQTAAHHIIEYWPIELDELAETTGEFTDREYREVLDQYFGPGDADMRFNEIWDEYGTLLEYYRNGSEDYERGLDRGIEIGYEKGYEHAKKQYASDE